LSDNEDDKAGRSYRKVDVTTDILV
jgi:hypothetical protein